MNYGELILSKVIEANDVRGKRRLCLYKRIRRAK